MQWFRMYAEFVNDPKVAMMPESYQARLVKLFCIRCGNDAETLHETMDDVSVAFQLRISDAEWMQTKDVFVAKGFIDESNNVLAWDDRQYVSDVSTERVRAFRERKKNGRVNSETKRNVSETPPDTDTDTDTDKKNTKKNRFDEFWEGFADKRGKAPAERAWKKLKPTDALADKIIAGAKAYAEHRKTLRADQTPKMAQGWLSDRRWEDEVIAPTEDKPADLADAGYWRGVLGQPKINGQVNRFMLDRNRDNWNEAKHGPSPWRTFNPRIPSEIYEEYGPVWGWVKRKDAA